MLALDCDTVIVTILAAPLAFRASAKPVSGINLKTRLSREYLEYTPAHLRIKFGSLLDLTFHITVYAPAGIIALAIVECREVLVNISSQSLRVEEVHRCPRYLLRFSERDESVICRKILRSVELEIVTQASDEDYLYDDISAGLLINKIRNTKQELLQSLSLYYRVLFLHENVDELLKSMEED